MVETRYAGEGGGDCDGAGAGTGTDKTKSWRGELSGLSYSVPRNYERRIFAPNPNWIKLSWRGALSLGTSTDNLGSSGFSLPPMNA